jgi:hypothetical protein
MSRKIVAELAQAMFSCVIRVHELRQIFSPRESAHPVLRLAEFPNDNVVYVAALRSPRVVRG